MSLDCERCQRLEQEAQEAQATCDAVVAALRWCLDYGGFDLMHYGGTPNDPPPPAISWSGNAGDVGVVNRASLDAAVRSHIDRTARLEAFVAALPDELESTLISAGECLICGALPEEDDGRHFPDCAGESLILAVQAAVGIEGGTE